MSFHQKVEGRTGFQTIELPSKDIPCLVHLIFELNDFSWSQRGLTAQFLNSTPPVTVSGD